MNLTGRDLGKFAMMALPIASLNDDAHFTCEARAKDVAGAFDIGFALAGAR